MSMTIEEAIKHFTNATKDKTVLSAAQSMDDLKVLNMVSKVYEANELALEVLQEKAEREDSSPLTIDDLLKMHGEPVYVTVPDKPHRRRWCIVDVLSPQPGLHGIEYFCHLSVAGTNAVNVYRHKPKEV